MPDLSSDGVVRLACAVIRRALDDLLVDADRLTHAERESAIGILTNRDETLATWCSLAGLNADVVQRHAQHVLTHRDAAPGVMPAGADDVEQTTDDTPAAAVDA